jgi:hypothetical protein
MTWWWHFIGGRAHNVSHVTRREWNWVIVVSAQNVTLSPPLRVYLWGYGVLLVLGAVGAVAWARRGRPGLAFPLLWLGLVALLVYLP